jgi:hypothetical protein
VYVAGRRGPVAEVGAHDSAGAELLLRQRESRRDRQAAAGDAVAAHVPDRGHRGVLAAALAAAVAGGLARELGEREVAAGALRQQVAVATVRW